MVIHATLRCYSLFCVEELYCYRIATTFILVKLMSKPLQVLQPPFSLAISCNWLKRDSLGDQKPNFGSRNIIVHSILYTGSGNKLELVGQMWQLRVKGVLVEDLRSERCVRKFLSLFRYHTL